MSGIFSGSSQSLYNEALSDSLGTKPHANLTSKGTFNYKKAMIITALALTIIATLALILAAVLSSSGLAIPLLAGVIHVLLFPNSLMIGISALATSVIGLSFCLAYKKKEKVEASIPKEAEGSSPASVTSWGEMDFYVPRKSTEELLKGWSFSEKNLEIDLSEKEISQANQIFYQFREHPIKTPVTEIEFLKEEEKISESIKYFLVGHFASVPSPMDDDFPRDVFFDKLSPSKIELTTLPSGEVELTMEDEIGLINQEERRDCRVVNKIIFKENGSMTHSRSFNLI